jgi:hypothetical protein
MPAPAPFVSPDLGYTAQSPHGGGATSATAGHDLPAATMVVPAGAGYGGYGTASGPYPGVDPTGARNGLAIASLVVSIASCLLVACYGLGGITGTVGAILGHVARRQIRERGERGDGMALAGIIIGWIALGLTIVLALFFVIVLIFALRNFN